MRLCFVAGIIGSSGFFVFFQLYPPTDFICVPSKLTLVCQKPTYSLPVVNSPFIVMPDVEFYWLMVSGHHIATDLFLYVHHLRIAICYTFHFEFLMNVILKMFKVLSYGETREHSNWSIFFTKSDSAWRKKCFLEEDKSMKGTHLLRSHILLY